MTVEGLLSEVSSRELSQWQALYEAEAQERAEAKSQQPQPGLGY